MPITLTTNRALPLPGATVSDKRLDDINAVRQALQKIDDDAISSITANYPGAVTAHVGTNRNYPNKTISLKRMSAWVSVAPNANIVLNVLKNDVTVQTLSIVSGQVKTDAVASPVITYTTSDYITIDVVSGTGTDLVVRLDY